jgi:hypothetical protein
MECSPLPRPRDISAAALLTLLTTARSQPPEYAQMAFDDRVGTHKFHEPTPGWGYLAQVNECFAKQHITISWESTRIAGDDHLPQFRCTPIGGFACCRYLLLILAHVAYLYHSR